MGTGLTECVVSGLLSTNGYKVLHVDRNDYYGGESSSLHLDQLYQKFNPEKKPDYDKMGRNRDYYVDIIPKFLMANGKLEKMLHLTGVTKYNMEFVKVSKCYVMGKKGKLAKVPCTLAEVSSSPLMSLFEKIRCKKFLGFISNYDEKNQKKNKHNLEQMTMGELYKKYKLSKDTIEFLGHSVALEINDDYMKEKAILSARKMNLYANSLAKYGDTPFIYPLYGLGELPQVFARLCAVYGGTYMLNTPITKVNYDDKGHVISVESSKYEGEVAKCKFVVADPSYFPDKCEKKGKIIRVINILDHPLPNIKADSCQIIIPQNKAKRNNDIYVCCTMSKHKVCPKGKYLAIVATRVETENPLKEIEIALNLLGPVIERFVYILDDYQPKEDGKKDGVFLSRSYDATTHFESCSSDIVDIFERITGKPFCWEKKKTDKEKQEEKSMK